MAQYRMCKILQGVSSRATRQNLGWVWDGSNEQ